MSAILALREKRAGAWDNAKSFLDEKRNDSGLLSAEDTEVYDRMENEVVALGKEIERLERQSAIDAELARATTAPITNMPNSEAMAGISGMAGSGIAKTGRASDEYRASFWNAFRGKQSPEVLNSLIIGVDSDGGYLVPDEYERTLIAALQEENIIRGIASIITTSSGERKIPVVASNGTAQWVEEAGVIPESDDKFSAVILGAHKVATTIKISDELLHDSAFNMENYIAREFARRIGRAEEEAFVVGDGVNKPTGFLNTAQLGVTTANPAAITLDEMLDLYHSLREPYRRTATFIMHDSTVKAIRKLKDTSGQFLWQPSIKEGNPDTILNRPIKTSCFMPSLEAEKKAVAFGDFSYYWVADRQGRVFKRLNELFAITGQIGYVATQRVDAKLILPEAIKYLQAKA